MSLSTHSVVFNHNRSIPLVPDCSTLLFLGHWARGTKKTIRGHPRESCRAVSLSLFICTCASSTFTFLHLYKFQFHFLAFGIFSHLPHSLSLIPLHNMIITLWLSVLFCTAYLSCYLYFLVFHSHFLFFLKHISSHICIFDFHFFTFLVRSHLPLSLSFLLVTFTSCIHCLPQWKQCKSVQISLCCVATSISYGIFCFIWFGYSCYSSGGFE